MDSIREEYGVDQAAAQSTTGGHRLWWAAIGSPAHSCIAARLSCAGCLAAAEPSAKARSRFVVTFRVKSLVCRSRPNRNGPPNEGTQRIVPVLNTPAPPWWA